MATRLYVLAMLARFTGLYLFAVAAGSKDAWFERRIHALQRIALYRELLRIAAQDHRYRIWRRQFPRR